MLFRDWGSGEKLRVGNLNEITVLIDRSETKLTEVAMNFWKKGLAGPPHSHASKEQVFFVTEGSGIVKVGKESHQVRPGALLYIPAGTMHQSIATDSSLTYLLFNAFLEPTKEGCANYREHIQKVKATREQQAAAAANTTTLDTNGAEGAPAKKPRAVADAGRGDSATLLPRDEAEECEVARVQMLEGEVRTAQHSDREQTLFVISGGGTMTAGHETMKIKTGTVIFAPVNSAQFLTASKGGLTYLSLSTFVT